MQKKQKISKISLLLLIAAIVAAGAAIWYIKYRVAPPTGPHPTRPTYGSNPSDKTNEEPGEQTLPTTFSLKIPFTSQAPSANWDELHNEACEEASAIMVNAYFSGITDTKLSPEYVESEISKLTEWEKNQFGYYLDIDSYETAKMIEEVYGLQTKVIGNYDEKDIQKELVAGNAVILAFNGKKLGNPNFRNGGPIYHMLVVRGYNKDGFVTNDPGTRNGMNYFYTWDTLYNAAGEWQHDKHATDQSQKLMIVVSK